MQCPMLHFDLVFLQDLRWTQSWSVFSLEGISSPLHSSPLVSIVLPLSCVFLTEQWSLFLCGSSGFPGAGRLSRAADSLSRCSSTGRPCHCSDPPLLCPAPLSTSLPTPCVLLFLCRCWGGSHTPHTTQWQNSPPIYISISLLIYLFPCVFLECC